MWAYYFPNTKNNGKATGWFFVGTKVAILSAQNHYQIYIYTKYVDLLKIHDLVMFVF